MNLPTVHIRRDAFMNILATVVEPFKHEGSGNLYGYSPTRTRNRYLVTAANAIACVSTRKNTEVWQKKLSWRRMRALYDAAPSVFRYLGDFHSHPEWGQTEGALDLSSGPDSDISEMCSKKTQIEIVVVISTRKSRHILWRARRDGSIRGSLGDYMFEVGAFTLEESLQADGTKKPVSVRLKLVAPVAIKALNRVNFSE